MAEHYSFFSEFDPQLAAETLGSEHWTTRDVAHGDGHGIAAGDAVLEVYPSAEVARVTTPDARVELFRVPRYKLINQRVVFEQGEDDNQSRLYVRADGKVTFHPVLRATESSTSDETTARGPQDSPAPPTSSESTTTTHSDPPAPPGQQEPPQVQLRGRLGRDPWYSDQGEQPIGRFPLAVNEEQGATTWHKVVVFGETAQELEQARRARQVIKGRLVDVTGRTVVRQEPKVTGGVRRTQEFHATAVTRVQAPRGR